jgi:hypothetical protein
MSRKKKTKVPIWLQGLLVAAGSGALTAVADTLTQSGETDLKRVGAVALTGAVLGVSLYLKQSPRKKRRKRKLKYQPKGFGAGEIKLGRED